MRGFFAYLGALALGLVTGAAAVLAHRSRIGVVPWGIVAAIAVILLVVLGIRVWTNRRLPAAFAAGGALIALGVLSFESFGGSVLIVDDGWGRTLLFGGAAAAILPLFVPRLRDTEEGASPE